MSLEKIFHQGFWYCDQHYLQTEQTEKSNCMYSYICSNSILFKSVYFITRAAGVLNVLTRKCEEKWWCSCTPKPTWRSANKFLAMLRPFLHGLLSLWSYLYGGWERRVQTVLQHLGSIATYTYRDQYPIKPSTYHTNVLSNFQVGR